MTGAIFPGAGGASALRAGPLPLGGVVQSKVVFARWSQRVRAAPAAPAVQLLITAAHTHSVTASRELEPILAVFTPLWKPTKKFRKITFYQYHVGISPPKSSHNTN